FKDQETNDYVGLGVHCAQNDAFYTTTRSVKFGQTAPSNTAVTDSLPNEPGGYQSFQAVFGSKYLTPQLVGAANSGHNRVDGGKPYPVTDARGNLTDLSDNTIDGQFLKTAGFPGFSFITASQALAYVADMQETGVPITYAYISDLHQKFPGQIGCSSP